MWRRNVGLIACAVMIIAAVAFCSVIVSRHPEALRVDAEFPEQRAVTLTRLKVIEQYGEPKTYQINDHGLIKAQFDVQEVRREPMLVEVQEIVYVNGNTKRLYRWHDNFHKLIIWYDGQMVMERGRTYVGPRGGGHVESQPRPADEENLEIYRQVFPST